MTAVPKVGLLFGGQSAEHEVSVVSARGVAAAMRGADLCCVPIGVTDQGRWLAPELSVGILEGDAARVDAPAQERFAHVLVDPGRGLLLADPGAPPAPIDVDVVFPLIHGWGGEDGRLQGLLELAGVPYVGAGVRGSAVAMDKEVSKRLFEARDLPVCPWFSFDRVAWEADAVALHARVADELGWPVFVKPANAGSSVGITRVARPADLRAAVRKALKFDEKIVVERGIDAREIECAVLGNADPQASVLGEILPSREFYDYAAKYLDGTSELVIPADLEPRSAERTRLDAVRAYLALDLRGFARVDFLVERGTGKIFLNEINTLPGFTPISMFPKLWEASGLAYPALVSRLVALAREGSGGKGQTRFDG